MIANPKKLYLAVDSKGAVMHDDDGALLVDTSLGELEDRTSYLHGPRGKSRNLHWKVLIFKRNGET